MELLVARYVSDVEVAAPNPHRAPRLFGEPRPHRVSLFCPPSASVAAQVALTAATDDIWSRAYFVVWMWHSLCRWRACCEHNRVGLRVGCDSALLALYCWVTVRLFSGNLCGFMSKLIVIQTAQLARLEWDTSCFFFNGALTALSCFFKIYVFNFLQNLTV